MDKNGRIIYVWYEKYQDGFVKNQGITLIKEYIIETEILETGSKKGGELSVEVKLKKNPEYFCTEDFYGKNVSGLTVVVGENGSGKTTLASMLMAKEGSCYGGCFFGLIISEDSIYVFSHQVKVNLKNEGLKKGLETSFDFSTVYVTNMFNFSELTDPGNLTNLKRGYKWVRQIYSPANLLKCSSEKAQKERYGYWDPNTNMYLRTIQDYAYYMGSSVVNPYIKKQEELEIIGYKVTSNEVREELDIFNDYKITISKGLDEFIENEVWLGAKRQKEDEKKLEAFYISESDKIFKEKENDFWFNIYVLCAREICFGCYGWGKKFVDSFLSINREINTYSIQKLEKMLAEIKRDDIKMQWFTQMEDCIKELKAYCAGKRNAWKLGVNKFDDTQDMVEWYYGELQKRSSFFKRNLHFSLNSTSTGELAMLNLFSYISDAIHENPDEKNFLLVIDEIDAGIHPRWQQRIISYLLKWLGSFADYNFQLIITSHSPIVLSDVLKEHVVRLKKKEKMFCVEETSKATFGANIAMQFLDSFFMDAGNIGEFSKEKIQALIQEIRDVKEDKELKDEERQRLLYMVDSIGENLVRKKLKQDLLGSRSEREVFVEQLKKCSNEQWEEIKRYANEVFCEGLK